MVLGAPLPCRKRVSVRSKRIAVKVVVYVTLDCRHFGRVRGMVQHSGKGFASIAMLSHMDDGCFSWRTLDERLVECAVLEGTLAYIEPSPDTIKVLAPLL